MFVVYKQFWFLDHLGTSLSQSVGSQDEDDASIDGDNDIDHELDMNTSNVLRLLISKH